MSGSRKARLDDATVSRIIETSIYLQTESRRLAREQCTRLGITATQLNVIKLLQTLTATAFPAGELSIADDGTLAKR